MRNRLLSVGVAAQLPTAQPGQTVFLRIATTADGGSAMEQTIIRA